MRKFQNRPFIDARWAARMCQWDDIAAAIEWGVEYGVPFYWDTYDSTARAYLVGMTLEGERRSAAA